VKNFPAGLIDNNIEFFIDCDNVFIIEGGTVKLFEGITIDTVTLLKDDLEAHPRAGKALDEMGITDPIERLKQYVKCRYADCNGMPDLTLDGKSYPEFYDCGTHNQCKWEGKLCAAIQAPNGFLTRREVELTKLIGRGLFDKEIAAKLNITLYTVETHRRNIEMKVGGGCKVDIARFAFENNII